MISIYGIIPARAGSKRLPGKHWLKLGEMSLIEITLRQAKKALPVSLLSSDDIPALDLAQALGVKAFQRPASLAKDDTPTEDVIRHHLLYEFKWFCLLQVTSPLRSVEDITNCIELAEGTGKPVISTCNGKRNGAVYVGKTIATDFFAGALHYEMPPERSIDIDTQEDFNEAERTFHANEVRTASTGTVLQDVRDQQSAA